MGKHHHPRGPRLRIEVTEQTIDESMARDSRHCMIAESIAKAVPGASAISVDLATIRFSDLEKRVRYTYLTPRVAQVQLVKFDQGFKPAPFALFLKNAHVTRAGMTPAAKVREQKRRAKAAGVEEAAVTEPAEDDDLRHPTRIRSQVNASHVPIPVGGQPPPLQPGKDGVPFSRRRAFGLRALEY